jgi:uncharacterized protein (TIGR02996 family)
VIDRLEEHEAFLRAIFDAPADDTPRLVYADFLDEAGEADRAEFIRAECEHRRLLALDPGDPGLARLGEVLRRQVVAHRRAAAARPGLYSPYQVYPRGFDRPPDELVVPTAELADPSALRGRVGAERPHWFGATALGGDPTRPLGPDEVVTLLDLPFTRQVTDWDLGGHVEEVAGGPEAEDGGTFGLIDLIERPVITLRGVEALAAHRGARRIRSLNLTHNQLGNDAVRALARSPHLIRLERLDFRDGNSPKGRVWQELVEQFGEKVVG